MSAVNVPDGRSSGKTVAAIVLGVVGVLLLILGFIYLAVPASSLPNFLPGNHIKGSTGHHALRMAASFVVGVVCLGGAWFVRRGGKPVADASASAPTDAAARD